MQRPSGPRVINVNVTLGQLQSNAEDTDTVKPPSAVWLVLSLLKLVSLCTLQYLRLLLLNFDSHCPQLGPVVLRPIHLPCPIDKVDSCFMFRLSRSLRLAWSTWLTHATARLKLNTHWVVRGRYADIYRSDQMTCWSSNTDYKLTSTGQLNEWSI
jgi:hypothetical protein